MPYSLGTPQMPSAEELQAAKTGTDIMGGSGRAGRAPTGVARQTTGTLTAAAGTTGSSPTTVGLTNTTAGKVSGTSNVSFRPNPFGGGGTIMTSNANLPGAGSTAGTSIAVTKIGTTTTGTTKPTSTTMPSVPESSLPEAPVPEPVAPPASPSFLSKYKWLLIGAGVLVAGGGALLYLRKRNKQTPISVFADVLGHYGEKFYDEEEEPDLGHYAEEIYGDD